MSPKLDLEDDRWVVSQGVRGQQGQSACISVAPWGLSFPIHLASLTSRLYVQAWSLAVWTVVWLEGGCLNPSCCLVRGVKGSLEAS